MSSTWTIRRSATDGKLTGLCAGVARRWAVDPVLVRVGCALLALSGGIGVVLYLAGWLLIPVEGSDGSRLDELLGAQAPHLPRKIWLAIVAVCCVAAFSVLDEVTPFGVGPAVILATIWYFGYHRSHRRTPSTMPPGPPNPASAPSGPAQWAPTGAGTTFDEAAEAWGLRVQQYQQTSVLPGPAALGPSQPPSPAEQAWMAFLACPDPVGLYTPAPAVAVADTKPATRSASRPAKRLRLVGLAAVLVVFSALAVAERLGIPVPLAGYLSAALLVVGLTLVAATWLGRARGLLAVGIALLVTVVATSVAEPLRSLETSRVQRVEVGSLAELPTEPLRQDLGRLEVDLSKVPLTSDGAVTAHVAVGSLVVTVPENVNVQVNYTVEAGVVRAYGESELGGWNLVGQVKPGGSVTGARTLTLHLSVGHGELQVRR